ncbi:osmotically inducible protein C [Paraliobacillus quinghaiensis]|uniref:Osmotically inducible protein C n=1 Tax=Paraliobacillus quinghaiensis TaxID=470815 RepID=A0A917WU73_9BACI|nr:OsmC family protein [Paraliobacillus quinghaiensis]GGM30114.1 osmotically inducible protein C [Paraliobacillus quinghaiensis]
MQFQYKEAGVRVDLPYGMLDISSDEDYGYRPYQLMVASIVGCSTSVFMKILEKQRVNVEDFVVRTEVERNEAEADRIEKIRIHYVIKGKNLSDEKLYKNLEIARKNCSMVRSVEDSIEIVETLETIQISM